MSTPELIAYLCFAAYLVGFLALTRAVARGGTDPWLFARGAGIQTITGWTFLLGFVALLVIPLVHLVAPASRCAPSPVRRRSQSPERPPQLRARASRSVGRRGSWRVGARESSVGGLVSDGPFACGRARSGCSWRAGCWLRRRQSQDAGASARQFDSLPSTLALSYPGG